MILETRPSLKRKTVTRPQFILQFAGQSSSYFQELKSLYEHDSLALGDFFQTLFDALEEEYAQADVREAFWTRNDFRLRDRLESSREPHDVSDVTISAPLILAAQIGNYLRFISSSMPSEELLSRTRAVIGHSQGVNAALLIAGGKEGPEFLHDFSLYLRATFRQAFRCRGAYPEARIPEYLLREELGAGLKPAPMASIQSEDPTRLTDILREFHELRGELAPAHIRLRNSSRSVVVVGPEETLAHLRRFLGKDAGRFHYLDVNIPFHSPYLEGVPERLKGDFARIGVKFHGGDLILPVPATEDGRDLRECESIAEYMTTSSTVNPLDWGAVVEQGLAHGDTSHMLNFGPGSALERLTATYTAGRGMTSLGLNTREQARSFASDSLTYTRPWSDYAPRAVRLPDGRPFILNEFSRFTGRPPVFGGGMTPTTVEIDMVVAAANTGRVVEWAGGGQVTEELMRKRLEDMSEKLEPGRGIIINLLYLDAYLWNLQYPLVRRLRGEGFPIDGVTISAGVPDPDEASRILDSLEAAGIHLNSFKPGTDDQIRRVLGIAKANPARKIIMQVEGGAAGGHHSWEKLRELVRKNYAAVRDHENVILAVGGGIHDEDGAADWLHGTWNPEQNMPVDAVFLGTRLMAAREARTADTVKAALSRVQGGDDWLRGKSGASVGGIVSGRSGLGADIYYAENHWTATSRRLEKLTRNKSPEEIKAALTRERLNIIRALNRTVKPYFGEVRAMTYARVLRRFTELTAPGDKLLPPEGDWASAPFIDKDYRTRLIKLIRRFENRFAPAEANGRPSMLADEEELDEPREFLERFLRAYPDMGRRRLLPEDENFFHETISLPGKPVNFIPILDENILKWYRSDSLWYSHCPGVDPDACAWIPGPVSVAGIQRVDEPVNEILESFEQRILENARQEQGEFAMAGPADDSDAWTRSINRIGGGFLAAVLSSPRLIRGKERVTTDLRLLFAVKPGRRYAWERDEAGRIKSICLYGSDKAQPELELRDQGDFAELITNFRAPDGSSHAYRRRFHPGPGPEAPVLESIVERETASADFYRGVWSRESGPENTNPDRDGEFKSRYHIREEAIRSFRDASGDSFFGSGPVPVPPNMAIVFAWESLVAALPPGGDLFRLLHRSHSFNFTPVFATLRAGEELDITARTQGYRYETHGKHVTVTGEISRDGEIAARFKSEFFIRGDFRSRVGEVFALPSTASRLNTQEDNTTRDNDTHAGNSTRIFGASFTTPENPASYAAASGDLNPIHLNMDFAVQAGLPQPITHGMWTSAQAMRLLIDGVLKGRAEMVESLESRFEAPVPAGEKLYVEYYHVANRQGRRIITIHMENEAGEPVYGGRAVLSPPRTAYVFTGQGSQAQGMGMDFYDRFPAAREVWERVEKLTREELGFSLLRIVRDNPVELRVDGELKRHPQGVLNLTEFTQPALVVKAMADHRVLESSGLLASDAFFAGHSLGEYAALACRSILDLEAVVRIVHHRGLTMQKLVERDDQGRSPFGMSVILANRSMGLNEAGIVALVDSVREKSGRAIEVVNFNIRDKQYSVTGYLDALEMLEQELRRKSGGHKVFKRLAGIDVPFHSSLLSRGVDDFREVLRKDLAMDADYSVLDGRYIPNLTAAPFEPTREYAGLVLAKSDSPVIADALASNTNIPEMRRTLLIELLAYQFARPVLWIGTQEHLFLQAGVERLIDIGARGDLAGMARQTLKEHHLRVVPEVLHIEENRGAVFHELEDVASPRPVATSESEETSESASESAVSVTTPSGIAPATPPATTPVVRENTSDALALPDANAPVDEPLKIMDGLKAVLAVKAGLRPDEMPETATIEEIFQGNSSKRNQALADLGAEFNTAALEGAHEKSLADTAAAIAGNISYEKPGPFLRGVFDEFVKNYMPGDLGRKELFAHMSRERLLPPGRIFAASTAISLLARNDVSAGQGPLSPIGLPGRFKDAKAALAWLDAALDLYGESAGISIPRPAQTQTGAAATVDAKALEELENKYFGIHGMFSRMWRFGREAIQDDPFAPFIQADRDKVRESAAREIHRGEQGEAYENSLVALFDPEKVVEFSSARQWAKRNLLNFFWKSINGETPNESEALRRQIQAHGDAVEPMRKFLENRARGLGENDVAEKMRELGDHAPGFRPVSGPFRPNLNISGDGVLDFSEVALGSYDEWITDMFRANSMDGHSAVQIAATADAGNTFANHEEQQLKFQETLREISDRGVSFRGRTALVTGAGRNSIALELVKNLLAGGMTVVVTTSSYSDERLEMYKRVFQLYGAKDARLLLVPFSQGSMRDVHALVEYIGSRGLQPDYLVPFGALGEENTLTGIDGDSLAGMRVMLLGVHGLIAALANLYKENLVLTRKFQVILPLSPNHGNFGRDGLYAETKLALEALFRKWFSEHRDWGRFARIRGCRIGWVRGTGLMELNDSTAPELEKRAGVRTFHRTEMGFLLTGLMAAGDEMDDVILANLDGGLSRTPRLRELLGDIRDEIMDTARSRREESEQRNESSSDRGTHESVTAIAPLGGVASHYPEPGEHGYPAELKNLNPEHVVCIVGYGEVGPGGSSRTRWELERDGEFSIEGAVELAWTMGLVSYEKTEQGGQWKDALSGEILDEFEIHKKYEKQIREGTGIRLVNAELQDFDPLKSSVYSDVVLEQDYHIPAADEAEARAFQDALPEETDVYFEPRKEKWYVRRRKGGAIKVLKAVRMSRYAAGQVPDGWNAERYGIPRDLARQVDRVTLFNLVATAEAFIAAGMEPFELYRYLHPAEVGNTSGSGMGGMWKLKRMFTDQPLDNKRQHDALQEALINVTSAWAITSMVGSAGPVQTPVAACATAGVSVDMAMNMIQEGRASFVVAGAFDDLGQAGMLGFGDMNATANTDDMLRKGISPGRMCRPNDARRGGFLESQGGGTILMARGSLALRLGLPVYGIVAFAATHADGIQASIPAPGLGLASVARAGRNSATKTNLNDREDELAKFKEVEELLREKLGDRADEITDLVERRLRHDFWKHDSGVSPLGGALSVFGLTADDIAVVYKHDTSTNANDPNENRLHHEIQQALGRTPGNPLFVVSQKSITGHTKGGAAAMQIIGLLQCMNQGVLPPNRNLDEVDAEMARFPELVFSDTAIHVGPGRIRAGLVTTLGFGHIGALILCLHGDLFLAMLDEKTRGKYLRRRAKREDHAIRRVHGMRLSSHAPLYERRMQKPYTDDEQELRVFLDADARMAHGGESYTV